MRSVGVLGKDVTCVAILKEVTVKKQRLEKSVAFRGVSVVQKYCKFKENTKQKNVGIGLP